ncbi:hypothetical protein [Treponema sp.]|uniref:hypothetical protein n=1 Tax=Treponema sp. TaxID=166 RepID=UPI003EFCD5C5
MESQFSSKPESVFSIEKIFKTLPSFQSMGITELSVSDQNFSHDKAGILKLAAMIKNHCPELFVSLLAAPEVLDRTVVQELQELYCSLEIPLCGEEKNGNLLFDKKLYSQKARLLNDAGLVFGFNMDWGMKRGDTFKNFRARLDFAVSLYPNHIDFPQLEQKPYAEPKPTGVYSSKDLDFSRGMAFACKTFYSEGRAVPWFCSVIDALKIDASSFFADFEEFQLCSNCSFETGFDPESAGHKNIEKLQLLFLRQKFEEKNKLQLFEAVRDIVCLNGAFSRVVSGEGESVVETSYNPDDLLSPYALDISGFCDNVTMENCSVKVLDSPDGPVYRLV